MIFIVMILKNVKRNQQLRSWRESIEKGQGKKKKRRWLRYTMIILGVLLIGICGYLYSIYHSLTNAVDSMHQPIRETSEKRQETVTLEKKIRFPFFCSVWINGKMIVVVQIL